MKKILNYALIALMAVMAIPYGMGGDQAPGVSMKLNS